MKICPSCQTRYEDGTSVCENDGDELVAMPAELSRNPVLLEPAPASPADRTSMIDLEAIEAQRRKKAAPASDAVDDGVDMDEHTPPPTEPIEEDGDATSTLQAKEARARRRALKAAAEAATAAPSLDAESAAEDDAPAAEPPEPGTQRTRRRPKPADDEDNEPDTVATRGTRSTQARPGTRTGMRRPGTRTGMTRPATRVAPAPPKRTLTGSQAGVLALVVVLTLVGAIIAVSRATAVLTVTTVPPGASVTVDGEVLGVSPIQKRVRTGSHTVELVLDGFESFKEVVSVPVGGLPFLQPLQKKAPPPPPPPTPVQIADELVQAAAAVLGAGDAELAKRKIDEALLLAPGHAAARAMLPVVTEALDTRNAELRRSEASAAREGRMRQARVLATEGRTLYEQGQLGRAKEKLYASLKLDGDNPEPHRTLGRIFNREDQVDKVRYHLQRYLDLGGADADFKVREWLKAHPR